MIFTKIEDPRFCRFGKAEDKIGRDRHSAIELCPHSLFLRFFVNRMLTAPRAEFLKFQLPFNGFLIFVNIIISPFALGAF